MAIGTFIAGRYSGTYDPPGGTLAADVGIFEKGWDVSATHNKELIGDTDAYADSVIDGIWRGFSNVMIGGTSIEWKAMALNALFPYNVMTPTGVTYLGPGIIGRLDSDVAGQIVMTSTAGTPSASTPASMTATYAIIAENFDIRWLMGPTLRKVPFRWRILPYSDSGTIKYFTAA